MYIDEYVVEITDAFLDNSYLVVTYDFTNNSSQETSFIVSIENKCWQNGIEIPEDFFTNYDTTRDLTNIKPGATISVQKVFDIPDIQGPVELSFAPFFDFTGNSSSIVINLSELESVSNSEPTDAVTESKELCAADFIGLTIPEGYELTDKYWGLNEKY